MPTYDYECESCGNAFEAFQKMSDPVLTECPKCGKKVHRVLSAGIGISFKGTGFYVNDSHNPPPKSPCDGCKKCSQVNAKRALNRMYYGQQKTKVFL